MQNKYSKLYKEAQRYCTSGTQTYSKSANRYVEGVYPYFLEGGSGPFVHDLDGNQYIDYPCALGAIILGYSHPYVNDRVCNRIKRGNIFSMPSVHEMELAKVIATLIPSMEQMRFLKSGSEAVSAAVKIARSYTGRDIILSNGYHGWHDWSTPITPKRSGTPEHYGSIISIKYDDIEDIKANILIYGDNIAAIVIDPYIFDEPSPSYFYELIKLAHKNDILVIFDEVVTGIRWSKWSVQGEYGVTPDLTCLGKTLANGIPISCVGGKRKIMEELNKDCFVSSTFGGDLIGIEGALATLKVAIDEDLPNRIQESGTMLQEGFNEMARARKLDASCVGNPARQKLVFPSVTHKSLFWQECLKRGVFLGTAQHTNLAHTSPILSKTLEVFSEALEITRLNWQSPKKALNGNLPQDVMIASMRGN